MGEGESIRVSAQSVRVRHDNHNRFLNPESEQSRLSKYEHYKVQSTSMAGCGKKDIELE